MSGMKVRSVVVLPNHATRIPLVIRSERRTSIVRRVQMLASIENAVHLQPVDR